jgi:hypothetical protein
MERRDAVDIHVYASNLLYRWLLKGKSCQPMNLHEAYNVQAMIEWSRVRRTTIRTEAIRFKLSIPKYQKLIVHGK